MQWVKKQKNKALAQASFREKIIVIQSQRKAMPKYGICAGFWFGSSWAQSQAVGRSIYILINTKKLLEIEKEIVREVARGDKYQKLY